MKLNNNDDSHNSGLNLLIYNMLLDIESHPTWVCGLKQRDWQEKMWGMVTPYVGVWIVTSMAQYSAISKMVTPCVGIYGLEHCSLVGQVYGRTVSIRPLMYFSPGF